MGYIIFNKISNKISRLNVKKLMFFCMLGAFFPDFDMLWFLFIDHGKIHHHDYFTHYPILWISLMIIFSFNIYYFCFALNGFIHIIMDTLVGDILWLAPFKHSYFALFKIPAIYKPWWINFLLHWSFFVEVLICIYAIYLYKKSAR